MAKSIFLGVPQKSGRDVATRSLFLAQHSRMKNAFEIESKPA